MIGKLQTIRARLTLWYILLLALTLLGFSLYLIIELRDTLLAQVDQGLQTGAVQAIGKLDTNGGAFRFTTSAANDTVGAELAQANSALRLIGADGVTLDGLGTFQTLPVWLPQSPGFATLVNEEAVWRVHSRPLQLRGSTVTVWLQSAQSLDGVYNTLQNLATLMLIGLPVVLLVATGGGLFLADRALRPVDRITRTATAVTADQLNQRISHYGPNDELARLTQTLNTMLARLQTAFETERRFTADASHELRTPLTVIKGHVNVALSRPRPAAEYVETLQTVQTETDRLIRLANDLLYLARLDASPLPASPEAIDLAELLAVVADQVTPLASAKGVELHTEMPPLPTLHGSADHLIRLFLNLLENGVKYTRAGDAIWLRAAHTPDQVVVEIEDSGPGIEAAHLPHLFQRFYRVPSAETSGNKGTGLGLAIAQGIAHEHGGTIAVRSSVGSGTTFTVTLPVSGG
ncbi:MAG: HAMP domain-containing sensor histidine kinase [Chloroflexota bacterium]